MPFSSVKRSASSSAKRRRRAILESSEEEDESASDDDFISSHRTTQVPPLGRFQLQRRPNSSEGQSLGTPSSRRRPKRPLKSSYAADLESSSDNEGKKDRSFESKKDYDTDDTGELIGSLQQTKARISLPPAKENEQPHGLTHKENSTAKEPPSVKPKRTIEDDTTEESSVDSVQVIEIPAKEAIQVSIESHESKQQSPHYTLAGRQTTSDNEEQHKAPVVDNLDDASSVDTAELMRSLNPNAALPKVPPPPDEFTLPDHDDTSSSEDEDDQADAKTAPVQQNHNQNAARSMEFNTAPGYDAAAAHDPFPRYGGPSVPSYSERIAPTQRKDPPPPGPKPHPAPLSTVESTRQPPTVPLQTRYTGSSVPPVSKRSVVEARRPNDLQSSQLKPPPSDSIATALENPTRVPPQEDDEQLPPSLNDDELQNAAFFDAPTSNDRPPGNNVLDLCDSEDEQQQVSPVVREGLRSARKSPAFASQRTSLHDTTTRQPPVYNSAVEEDIECFSDEEDAAAFGFGRRSSQEIPRPNLPLSQPHYSAFSQEQASTAPMQARESFASAQPSSNPAILPQPWQANTERRRRLRDATASDTSFARAVVRKDSVRPRIQPPPPAAAPSNVSEVEWQSHWNVARATGGAPRNDVVGGSGVGAGNYQMLRQPDDDEPAWTQPQAPKNSKRRGRGGKQRSWKGGRWKKGGKRGGRGRGRGGATASRRTNRGGGSVAGGSAWSDYEGGGAWNAHASRDDPNLGHVGGAEISF